ncbi:family 78 glycoside hydrolase catalytic domain [Paenibacillus gallinarum]|uniref:alpha-L-rhamnosidase n=1 Tax=Paenibacillus gallinarum TaxID=2762232 RepID=A0ABR8T652_9BACL|nr:family 78 glycoside hydrolase catalytic domain [Paenibacillus gallinarum]MBD7971211.1 family 78 glycoside hydrolase catalytic domain [Paenibacillus gallinarum]
MNVKDLRIEYQKNPIGLDTKKPRFSWKVVSEDQNVLQTAYRIIVTKERSVVWDSGREESSSSVLIEYEGKELIACSLYDIQVKVWDNKGNEAITEGSFETGLLKGVNFSAEWISHDLPAEETACPIFTKEFQIDKEVEKVRVFATALGVYEIKINGQKLGDTFFAPGWTNYKKRLQYQTYEADQILEKQNKIEITVGNGWYKGIFGFTCTPNHYGDRTAALAEVHITYSDGTSEILGTDQSWGVTTGAIRSSEIYMGETIDSCFEGAEVRSAVHFSFDKKRIVAQESEPVRITKKIPAKELIVTSNGETVIDFGQNLTGFVEVKVKGNPGQKITLRHAEVLDKDGNFYPDTLRQAISHDHFICNGQEQILMPHFTFHGFRYISVEGIEDINLEHFTACVLYTHMEETGTFITSNPLVNQLQSNIQWSQRGNFLDIPTDCPQRDERLGWTGDAQVFAGTAAYNMNTALFFTKWLRDLASEQSEEFGVPHVVPNILGEQEGAAAWSDAAVIIPWVLYETYGDVRILEEQYESMKGWVDFISARCDSNGLWQSGFQYGDWLALDKEESADRTGATDKYLVANAYYAYSANIVRKTAEILKKKEDAHQYGSLYEKIKRAFNEEYITSTGRIVSETQTGCILALHFDLAEEKYRERILQSLETNIANHKNHLSTGFVGTPYLCHTLTENNLHDLAGTIFMQEDYPSWLYSVKKGATTIWERWNSILPNGDFDESGMNSLNHYAYGSIGEWMYRRLAGINAMEPGYKKILIKPQFVKGITFVDASFDSVYGEIKSKWSCENKQIQIDIEIPANTTAVLYLPEQDEPIEVGSGSYHYEYATDTSLEKDRFSMESTLKEILDEPLAVAIFNEHMPELLNNPMIEFAYQMSINEMLANAPAEGKPLFEMVINTLNQSYKAHIENQHKKERSVK